MNDAQFDRLHEKIDSHAVEVEHFRDEAAGLARQVANCDRLIRLANASLCQIDDKIAKAARISGEAHQIANAAGIEASQAATTATRAAVDEMVGALAQATDAARKTGATLNVLQFKTGWWITLYAALTLLCCLATAYITGWALRGKALTPEQAHYVELGKAHEALLANASDKELKLMTAIRARPAKGK